MKSTKILIIIILLNTILNYSNVVKAEKNNMSEKNIQVVTFGAGCFWCVEAIFQRLDGVIKVESGYSGGTTVDPSYEEVCTGNTGHAEVVQITFDANIIAFKELLKVFWSTHDPTTLNRQGADVGTQYRSAIFYHSEEQKLDAEEVLKKLDENKIFASNVVTEISMFEKFYPAEEYHQNYYNQNKSQPYCQLVINPKIDKLEKLFSEILKSK